MASNPLYNTNDSPNGATQPSKAVNDMQVFVNRNRNTFDLSYFNFKTQRFGQYEPFFVMEGVPGDTIPLHSSHQVRSLPMKSPFLSSLTLSKDYFMVPMQAILPNTWEMIFSNPASGDDVPDDANCLWPILSIASIFTKLNTVSDPITKLRMLFIGEMLFSSGSLLQQLGFTFQDPSRLSYGSFDSKFNEIIADFYNSGAVIGFSIPISTSSDSTKYLDSHSIPLGVFTDFLRFNLSHITSVIQGTIDIEPLISWYNNVFGSVLTEHSSDLFNISRILAYQLSCQQFYVNSKIDPIYNSQIYRDNFFYLLNVAATDIGGSSLSMESFSRNGINVPYDFFSLHYFINVINTLLLSDFETKFDAKVNYLYDICEYVFSFRRVLKFGDYFTSSRTQPLGTDVNGQMNAPVVGDKVAAIDMSKSIVMQRFLNNVVKLGNDFGEYLRGIFGTEPSPDYHFPKFISHQEFNVSGFEVANSNDTEQGKLVTNLNTNDDRFAFEVRVDMPCIILGISSFNCPRLYGNARPRFVFHKDRFDMFNPMLQYIGDQPVNTFELFMGVNQTFGYQSRNSEYKQAFSVASGGFLYDLPAWSFLADFGPDYNAVPNSRQNSEFIRVYPFEFDRFYSALSGISLGDSFHFIVVYNNKVMASRPMAVNPSIL